MTPAQIAIYAALAALTTLYAMILERYKDRWEPRYTWVEVAVGNALCLSAATLCVLVDPLLSAWAVAGLFVLSFVVGGLPIIIWQLTRNRVLDRERLERALRKGAARYAYPATTLAGQPESLPRSDTPDRAGSLSADHGDAGRLADGDRTTEAEPGPGA